MTDALVVSNVLLWLAVLVLAGVVLALLRQVGVLHERLAPVGALTGGEGPAVGEPAPILEVADWNGDTQRIGGRDDAHTSTLLFFVSPTCPVCKTLLPIVHSIAVAEGPGLRVVLASDGPRAEHEAFVRRHTLDRTVYVLSEALGLAYSVGRLPHAVLIGADGVVRGKGLVNTREHLESLFEARDRGVASVQDYLSREKQSDRVAESAQRGTGGTR
jgi:methylamine dehydrogenase accessory protein MauD